MLILIQTYLSSPTSHGGNEELSLKEKKEEKKSTKPGKDGKVVEAKKNTTFFWFYFLNIDYQRS
jgi:hypothetical protein